MHPSRWHLFLVILFAASFGRQFTLWKHLSHDTHTDAVSTIGNAKHEKCMLWGAKVKKNVFKKRRANSYSLVTKIFDINDIIHIDNFEY